MARTETLPLGIHALRRLNPALSCLLTSCFHGLASQRLLVLAYRGRKSGKQYQIPLVYVAHADQIYCVTRDTLWWKSAVSAPSITLWLRGQPLHMRAERADADDADTQAAFSKFLRHNPGTARLLYHVPVDSRGEPDRHALAEQLQLSNVIRFKPADGARS